MNLIHCFVALCAPCHSIYTVFFLVLRQTVCVIIVLIQYNCVLTQRLDP